MVTNADASILTKVINLPLAVEATRDYFGMDGGSLLAVVHEAKRMLKALGLAPAQTRDWSKPVLDWLTRPHVPLGDLPHAVVAVGKRFVADR